ncbi:hypothetical protein Pcinc_025920 [Petrolisthes cinctipes]|uniref:C3HC-type domain-containing protein n=1 Tax=Petrolisthes cinctipes TaxID=88211 RepID=A0AAE1F9J8_PETCI|nr:hypothetical protein Pcinc_034536 [Petrolisthes cinctipes]KAK3868713.1 hypothetical protein Pcinc_025920 [Petrolisthes cinctipes]
MDQEVCTPTSHTVTKICEVLDVLSGDNISPASPWQLYGCEDKENRGKNHEASSTEAFYGRVSTYGPGLWGVTKLSPLECARWGWQVIEHDVLECVSCHQVLCATLPSTTHTEAYSKFLQQLRDNLVDRHRESCMWRYNPVDNDVTQPPLITTSEHLLNLTNAALTLAHLASALPYLHIQQFMEKLHVDEELVSRVFVNGEIAEDMRKVAVLLVLSGWSRGHGSYLRCQVCRRTVGLWSLYTIADQLKKTEEKEEDPITSGKRKISGTLEDSEDGGKTSPKKHKDQDKGETSDVEKSESAGGRTLRKRSKSEERVNSPDKNLKAAEGSSSPQKSDSQGGKSPRRSKRIEEGGSSSKKVDEGWSMQLRGRRVSDQSSDDGSSSGTRLRGRHVSEQSSDESACGGGSSSTQQEQTTEDAVTETPRSRRRARRAELAKERLENLSPLIIGSSPSTQIQKVEKKRYFDPLEEHRYWCTWVIEAACSDSTDSTDQTSPLRGYHVVAQSVREKITLSSRQDVLSTQKYASNVEGLRSIRNLLNDLIPEPFSQP